MGATIDRSIDVSDQAMMLEKLLLEQVEVEEWEGIYKYRSNPNNEEELRLSFGLVTKSVSGLIAVSGWRFRFEQEGLASVDAVSEGSIHYAVLTFDHEAWMTRTFVQTYPHLGLDTASLEAKTTDVDYDPLRYMEWARSDLK